MHTPWRRPLLATLAALLLVPSCAPGFEAPSKINTLRILSVTADKPYAAPGDEVTLSMTYHDGAHVPSDPASAPREVQIVWLGGCFDPPGDLFVACFEQLAEVLAPLAAGGLPPEDVVKLEQAAASDSGVPDAHTFTFRLPDDIVTRRPPPPAGPHYGIAYVFFAACAGTIVPVALEAPGGGDTPDFPLECRAGGETLGSDSFVIGYTQVYAFADLRQNQNPPTDDLHLDGVPLATDPESATVVPLCPATTAERRAPQCGGGDPTEGCIKHRVDALIGDVAEIDPEALDTDGNVLREVMWVSYFSDGGDLSPGITLVSDSIEGYQAEHHTEWTAPETPGVYQLWAVTRDQRGGSSVVRRYVRVE
jgi:hypothetical protein